MENSAKFEIRILKFISGGSSSQHHAEFFHFTCLTEDGKKCTKNSYTQPLYCSLNLLLSDVPDLVFLETANQPVLGDERYNCITCR